MDQGGADTPVGACNCCGEVVGWELPTCLQQSLVHQGVMAEEFNEEVHGR